MSPRDRIVAALDALGPDEAEVLALVAERLVLGRRIYGELHAATDPRDFAREALEEAADGLVYVAAALVRAGEPWGACGANGKPVATDAVPLAPEGRLVGADRSDP